MDYGTTELHFCISCVVEHYDMYNLTRETPALEAKRQRCAEYDAVGSLVVH